jgi:hypothetical protein
MEARVMGQSNTRTGVASSNPECVNPTYCHDITHPHAPGGEGGGSNGSPQASTHQDGTNINSTTTRGQNVLIVRI